MVLDDMSIESRVKIELSVQGVEGVDVDVNDGVVTLEGELESEQSKQQASDVAMTVGGVKSVDNQVEVV